MNHHNSKIYKYEGLQNNDDYVTGYHVSTTYVQVYNIISNKF